MKAPKHEGIWAPAVAGHPELLRFLPNEILASSVGPAPYVRSFCWTKTQIGVEGRACVILDSVKVQPFSEAQNIWVIWDKSNMFVSVTKYLRREY